MAKRIIHKSAKDGRFVSKQKAKRNPDTTYQTRVSTPRRRGKK